MRVCLVSTEFLGLGATGGIGVGVRTLGRHLLAAGVDVSAIVPSGRLRGSPFELEGIPVRTYDKLNLKALIREARDADADVYHCVQASAGALLVQKAMPGRAHVVECIDPRDWQDWRVDFQLPTHSRFRLVPSFLYFGLWPAALSARRADVVQVPARFLQPKSRRIYGLSSYPQYVPMPFDLPADAAKSKTPLVAYVGRLVRRKRPEIVFDLAQQFPAVRFVIVGGGFDESYSAELYRYFSQLRNVNYVGFVNQADDQRLFDYLSKAWILINTAAREGLPLSFIEAAAHGCAILSECNPDGYAAKFGFHVSDGDFQRGLQWLLADDKWKPAGERGRTYVKNEHLLGDTIARQLSVYDAAVAKSRTR